MAAVTIRGREKISRRNYQVNNSSQLTTQHATSVEEIKGERAQPAMALQGPGPTVERIEHVFRGVPYSDIDPHRLARLWMRRNQRQRHSTVRYWRDEWWRWDEKLGVYRRRSVSEVKAELRRFVQRVFEEEPVLDRYKRVFRVNEHLVNNVMAHLLTLAIVPADIDKPAWLTADGQVDPSVPPDDMGWMAMKNGLIRLSAAHETSSTQRHTPRWFSSTVLPYEFQASAESPHWMMFLQRVLEGDHERITLLQEFFGYCLVSTTKTHQFLLLIGSGANGKSVTLDVLTAMLGEDNVSHVSSRALARVSHSQGPWVSWRTSLLSPTRCRVTLKASSSSSRRGTG
jgi:hypothetical protein